MIKRIVTCLWLFCAIANIFAQTANSPDGKIKLDFNLSSAGEPFYKISLEDQIVIKNSKLGFEIQNIPGFSNDFIIQNSSQTTTNKFWKPIWGEQKNIKNNYSELKITLQQQTNEKRILILTFRVFNDGVGFRYEFPEQKNLNYFIISNEVTEFALTGDHKAFWIPGDYDTNEYSYTTSLLSEVDAISKSKNSPDISVRMPIGENFVQTPLMLKSKDGIYINIHEAALINYPAMNLKIDKKNLVLSSQLVPDAIGNMAYLQAPCTTPWRTIIISKKATDILASNLILNLNDPSSFTDVSWIKPQKFVGVWWEMHVGTASWNYSDVNNIKLATTDWSQIKPNGRHGATTQRTKQYIDFAAKHGFDGVLVEGWNVGWEDWFGNWKDKVFDFVTPYPDFDVKELTNYASTKKVKLIMHHETSASAINYERNLDSACRFMQKYGYNTIKSGYVGRIIPRGEHHDGQFMVNHYIWVLQTLEKFHFMLDAHEPVRPTGLHRTYPNLLACEAARGNEFNAWSVGNMPEHETILPFTRLMGGPMDYTPGIFQIKMNFYKKDKTEQVHTTLVKQLALYVTMYSPIQMAADLPENYELFPDAFQFIKDVPVDWDESLFIEAEPGDYISIARKAKDKEEWFIGAITDENARLANIPLDFLQPDKTYVAILYLDSPNADWKTNPMQYSVSKVLVSGKTILKPKLAPGGGAAISIKIANEQDIKNLKKYKP